MDAKVVSFDIAKRARLATQDPEGIGQKPEAPIPHVFDRTPRAAQLTEVHGSLDQACNPWVQGLQLAFHLTNMAALSVFFMTAYASALNRSAPAAESNAPFRNDRLRPHG